MLSDAAKEVCGRWFAMGKKSTLVSHEPHETLMANANAVYELLGAGIITREIYNDQGSVLFRGTPASLEIGEEPMKAAFERMFGGPDEQRIVGAALRHDAKAREEIPGYSCEIGVDFRIGEDR